MNRIGLEGKPVTVERPAIDIVHWRLPLDIERLLMVSWMLQDSFIINVNELLASGITIDSCELNCID